MANGERYNSGSPWESQAGYSRALKKGNHIWVAGTTAVDAKGEVVAQGDMANQARYIFNKIGQALLHFEASFEDVVRTRMYVTDIKLAQELMQVHGELFKTIQPSATLVEVKALMLPGMLVEIEVDAYCASQI